jgi:hypothetical protein
MDKVELEKRTKQFALKIIAFVATLPQTRTCAIIEYQLVKAGTSVGANYIEKRIEQNRGQTSFTRLASLRRNVLKAAFGWRSATKLVWEMLSKGNGCCRNRASCLQFLRA